MAIGKDAVAAVGAGPLPVVNSRSAKNCGDPRYLLRKGITLTFIGFALTIGLSFIGFSDGGLGILAHGCSAA